MIPDEPRLAWPSDPVIRDDRGPRLALGQRRRTAPPDRSALKCDVAPRARGWARRASTPRRTPGVTLTRFQSLVEARDDKQLGEAVAAWMAPNLVELGIDGLARLAQPAAPGPAKCSRLSGRSPGG